MKKFSNAANRKIAESNGASLICYLHNGDSIRDRAIELSEKGRIVYYEKRKPSRQYPNGGGYLYEVNPKPYLQQI